MSVTLESSGFIAEERVEIEDLAVERKVVS